MFGASNTQLATVQNRRPSSLVPSQQNYRSEKPDIVSPPPALLTLAVAPSAIAPSPLVGRFDAYDICAYTGSSRIASPCSRIGCSAIASRWKI